MKTTFIDSWLSFPVFVKVYCTVFEDLASAKHTNRWDACSWNRATADGQCGIGMELNTAGQAIGSTSKQCDGAASWTYGEGGLLETFTMACVTTNELVDVGNVGSSFLLVYLVASVYWGCTGGETFVILLIVALSQSRTRYDCLATSLPSDFQPFRVAVF